MTMFSFNRDQQLWIDGRLVQFHRMEMTVENEGIVGSEDDLRRGFSYPPKMYTRHYTFSIHTNDGDFLKDVADRISRVIHIKDISEDRPRTDMRFGATINTITPPPSTYDSDVYEIQMRVIGEIVMKPRGVSLDHLADERDIALRALQRAQALYDKANRAHAVKEHQVSLDEDLR